MLAANYLMIGNLFAVLGISTNDDAFEEKTVQTGERVSIPCPLAGPGGSVQWLQNGVPVVLDPSSETGRRRQWSVSPDGKTAALTIFSVRRSDAGLWECRELASNGNVRKIAKVLDLVVGSSPIDPYLELEGRRLAHQATVTVKEPQALSLHCVVSGAVPPVRHIHWTLGDVNVTSWSELFVEFSASDDAYISRSVLSLNMTRRVHAQELICRVHHVTWMQAAAVSASLNVLYEPSFSISREPGFGLPLVEEMQVSLQCDVDANPTSDPVWVRDDGPMAVNQGPKGFLNFTPVAREHAGWYRCTTHHQFGFYASFGYFLNVRASEISASSPDVPAEFSHMNIGCIPDGRPEVTAVNKSLMTIAGKSAVLAGQLCSSPRLITVFWVLRHLVLRPGDMRHPYVAYNLTETGVPKCWLVGLELRHLEVEDSGEVLLVAKNQHGTSDAAFHLNVTHASASYATSTSSHTNRGCSVGYFILPCIMWLQRYIMILDIS